MEEDEADTEEGEEEAVAAEVVVSGECNSYSKQRSSPVRMGAP